MPPPSRPRRPAPDPGDRAGAPLDRLDRPPSLVAQVERLLREAIVQGRFPGNRLPTEMELAEQLGVSRETVRRATETLEREGLLVKYRRKGTFTAPPVQLPLQLPVAETSLLGYLQADYHLAEGQEESATRAVSGILLQGALEEASRAGFELVMRRAPHLQMGNAFRQLSAHARLRGVLFASFGEEKLLRRVAGLGLPTVLLDHDLHLPQVSSVRDDSCAGARLAVEYLASLGHRRIAFAHWHRADLNPWRLTGYRQGLRDARLPRRRVWELPAELTEAGARQLVDALERVPGPPTALLCFNNTLARLVIDELRRRGRRVPEDLSIMGGGGEEVADLTCHQADWYTLGRTAVQVLLRAVAAGAPFAPEHHLAPHTLRLGRTTAPPPD